MICERCGERDAIEGEHLCEPCMVKEYGDDYTNDTLKDRLDFEDMLWELE